MDEVQTVVVGAGVVGLAVAAELARRGREVIVLEAEPAFGSATSARHSEVIHAGLYYPVGSCKARMCVQGRELLYAYAAEHGIAHQRCGKLVVATAPEQHDALAALEAHARACGVQELERLSAEQVRAMEPALHCTAALWSPATGIVDSHALMLSLLGELEGAGGWLALCSPLQRVSPDRGALVLEIGGASPMRLRAREVVNSAGLHAQALAHCIDGLDPAQVPPAHWARGHYFALGGAAPFTRLVYPLPEPGGLGVHATLDLGGQMRFGPDVQWVPVCPRGQEDYSVDPARQAAFEASIRRYWPGLPDAALHPDYAGIRPKVVGPGQPAADFVIQGPAEHGVAGLVNLFGIESPGLTSALALAGAVATLLDGRPGR